MITWGPTHWTVFSLLVTIVLILDLFVLHREDKEPSLESSLGWTAFWCALALVFCGLVWYWGHATAAITFLTGYFVEWSLSMDNVFVFVVIFQFFRVPLKYHYKILFWGILVAVILRLAFIMAGIELVKHFEWIMVLFGAFLVYTGIKLTREESEEIQLEKNFAVRLTRRFIPLTLKDHGGKFFVREGGKILATPLFLVLMVINLVDVVFATDSIPAIFGISRDPFIIFTSNVFAILGLRALYFVLAGFIKMFRYLRYGLCAILVFIGAKMLLEYFFAPEDHGHLIPPLLSLAVVFGFFIAAVLASIYADHRDRKKRQ